MEIVSNIASGLTLMLRVYALYGQAKVSLILKFVNTGLTHFVRSGF